jgi:ankyrin repeat protein
MARDVNGTTALHGATFAGHKEMAGLLLVNKAEVNAKNSKGHTPLHLAVWNGHEAVLK